VAEFGAEQKSELRRFDTNNASGKDYELLILPTVRIPGCWRSSEQHRWWQYTMLNDARYDQIYGRSIFQKKSLVCFKSIHDGKQAISASEKNMIIKARKQVLLSDLKTEMMHSADLVLRN